MGIIIICHSFTSLGVLGRPQELTIHHIYMQNIPNIW